MIRDLAIVRKASARVARAVDRTCEALRQGRVEQEPAFTDRMLGMIEEAMNGYASKGVSWTAKSLTDRGRNAQEREHGADFAGVLSIDLNGFQLAKGFLAQAKLLEPNERLGSREFARLREQCDLMLKRTAESFVFLYSGQRGVSIVPAVTVVSSHSRDPHEFYARSVARFFEGHFTCFVGDRRISTPTPDMLEWLLDECSARTGLCLEARAE